MGINKEEYNNTERAIFRRRIYIKSKDIEFNSSRRIQLPAEKLDYLLFDYDEEGKKYFGYFYDGLSKIDLSSVDFEDTIFVDPSIVNLEDTNAKIDFSKPIIGPFIIKEGKPVLLNETAKNVSRQDAANNEFYRRTLSALINGTLDDIDKQLPSIGGKNRKDAGEKKKEDKTTGSGSFYGCDNVPEVKKTSEGKKLKNTMNLGSFYGCGNVPGEE